MALVGGIAIGIVVLWSVPIYSYVHFYFNDPSAYLSTGLGIIIFGIIIGAIGGAFWDR